MPITTFPGDGGRTPGVRRPLPLYLGVVAALLVLVGCARSRAPTPVREDVRAVAARVPDAVRRDVVLLRSPDFAERNQAAGRLVARGESAIPVLGEAGEGMTSVHASEEVSTTRPVLRAILEDLPKPRLEAYLGMTSPVVRSMAAEELGRRSGWSGVPRLIHCMEDDDLEVRAAAVASLRRLTNRFFGFDPRAGPRYRRPAAERWRDWWTVEGRARAQREDAEGSG